MSEMFANWTTTCKLEKHLQDDDEADDINIRMPSPQNLTFELDMGEEIPPGRYYYVCNSD